MGIVFLGPPGVGKGTQGRLVAEQLGKAHISTGEMLRAAVDQGTLLGQSVSAVIDQGLLVDDRLMIDLVRDRLNALGAKKGFVLDGFPRTLPQAHGLDDLLERKNRYLTAVVSLTADTDEIVRRLLERSGKEDRPDDTPETIARRMDLYRRQSEPLIAYYAKRDVLISIRSRGSIEEVHDQILSQLRIRCDERTS